MLQKTKLFIKGILSQNDSSLIETEIDVLSGVKSIDVNEKTGESQIEFEDGLISHHKIIQVVENLGYQVNRNAVLSHATKEHLYFVKGMHCASCELLIEKKLLKFKNIKSVEASANKGEVRVEYEEYLPIQEKLNKIFSNDGYTFFDSPPSTFDQSQGNIYKSIIMAAMIIAGFVILNKLGLSSWLNVSSASSLPAFFVLGLLAGLSSCAALVGGLVLSLSKQWLELYQKDDSLSQKIQPHLMFNAGRLASYGILGAILGGVGSRLQISLNFTAFLVIAISFLMILLGMQMLGVKKLRKFQLSMPKFITRHIADESKFQGRFMPFVLGALTFFLPCGFTLTAQGMALLSGSPLQGGLIMFLFALGTAPALLAIGLTSVKFSSRPHFASRFIQVAGTLLLFFAIFNINAQLNVLGAPSLSNLSFSPTPNSVAKTTNDQNLPPIVNGKQLLKMEASSSGYRPNYLKVKAGVPVRWEITDTGTSGCTNAIISRNLFPGQIDLTPGKISVKEFNPQKPGKYKFSCWMGMVSGVIEVVGDKQTSSVGLTNFASAASDDNNLIPSGAQGCGCGGGSSCGAR